MFTAAEPPGRSALQCLRIGPTPVPAESGPTPAAAPNQGYLRRVAAAVGWPAIAPRESASFALSGLGTLPVGSRPSG